MHGAGQQLLAAAPNPFRNVPTDGACAVGCAAPSPFINVSFTQDLVCLQCNPLHRFLCSSNSLAAPILNGASPGRRQAQRAGACTLAVPRPQQLNLAPRCWELIASVWRDGLLRFKG